MAGSIDLKVDHAYASYNGEDCETCIEQTTNLVTNGSFEEPEVTSAPQWDIFPSPASGWNIEWRADVPATYDPTGSVPVQSRPTVANLELHEGVLGSASEGNQYTELDSDWGGHTNPQFSNEPASTSIYQTITTVPSRKYKLRFAWAPRPSTTADQNRLEVKWDGVVVHDTGNVADPNAGITWTEVEVEVTAIDALTELRFTDLGTAESNGTFLDNVRLFEILCGFENGQCKLWDEKDLEDGDFYWNFDDVKPGDWGRNVISLHVEDNDAWACLVPHDVEDNENVLTDPEADAGDTTGVLGELSQFINIFAWRDDNQNGIFDGAEVQLYGENTLFDLLNGIAVSDSGNGELPLTSVDTRYVGIAWCMGDMTNPGEVGMTCDGSNPILNQAQTDELEASMVAYAEQTRNNSEFLCSDVFPPNP